MSRITADQIEKGTEVEAVVFAVRDFEVNDKGKGPYAKCVLFDATGELQGMWFDYKGSRTALGEDELFVRVTGRGDTFNGTRQIKISDMTILAHGDDFDFSPFIRESRFGADEIQLHIEELIGDIEDPELAQVVAELFFRADNFERFMVSPAAMQNHHAYRRGLAEHVYSMARLAKLTAAHYNVLYGNGEIDTDLLVAGVLLHDFAKIFDFEPDGLGVRYSLHGHLVGHIPECDALIRDVCVRCNISERTTQRLRHMVLSHHGQKDWGSPVEPMLIEARILHQIDMIDSRLAMMREIVAELEPGEVSERSWALRGRVAK